MIASTWPIPCPQYSAKRSTMASALCKAWTRSSQHLLPRVTLFPSSKSSLDLASRSPFPVRCLADTASHMPGQAGIAHQATSAPALSGRIDVIFGPMFAGKSSELLKRVKALEVQQATILTISVSSLSWHSHTLVILNLAVVSAECW
ncbi:TPA: Thymidine kinase, cytosolic [Trebouxia sp. C0006]